MDLYDEERLSDDRRPRIRALIIAMMALPTVAIALRIWSRALSRALAEPKADHKFWWDDWMAFISLPFALATNAMGLWSIACGLGRHVETTDEAMQAEYLLTFYISSLTYNMGITFARSSALFFYARIFKTDHKLWFYYALWVNQLAVFGWLIGTMLSDIFTCTPIRRAWLREVSGSCVNDQQNSLGHGITSSAIDLAILVIPLPLVWKLHLQAKHKWLVFGVFLCGYSVFVVSLGRTIEAAIAGPQAFDDVTWDWAPFVCWIYSETPTAIFTVSLPSIFFLFRKAYKNGISCIFTFKNPPDASNDNAYLNGSTALTKTTSGYTVYTSRTMVRSPIDGNVQRFSTIEQPLPLDLPSPRIGATFPQSENHN